MKYTIKDIVEIGIFVGLALVLNLHVFSFHIAAGPGSISFTMVPLCVIALRKSWWKTFIAAGIIYGLIACVMDAYPFITYPLDYMLAYGSVALISLVRKPILENKYGIIYLIISMIVVTLLRLSFATLDGMFVYHLDFVGSLIYNAPYISVTGAVTLGVLIVLYKPLQIIIKRYPDTKEIQ